MINAYIDRQPTNRLISISVIFGVLLAAWIQYIQHGWINSDSILYFEQVKHIIKGDWEGALHLYKWPFYAICISVVHQLTSLSMHAAAQLLNVVFFGIATYSFLKIVQLINGNNRTIFFAACLLFSSQYIVGDVLEMLMRDEGFWAFYLSGLYFFIRFALQQKLADALAWQLCMVIAMLFRLEGILYLVLLPALFLMLPPRKLTFNIQAWLKTYCIVFGFSVLIGLVFISQPNLSMAHFGRLEEIFTTDFFSNLTKLLFKRSDVMAQNVLGRYLDEFALVSILSGFTMITILKSVTATGWASILAVFSIRQHFTMHPVAKVILLITIGITLFGAGLIITKVFVLSKRYLVALVWVMLIFASFQLAKISTIESRKARLLNVLFAVLLTLGFIKNILPKQAEYNYRQQAVAWLQQQNIESLPVFYNDNRLIYYANAPYQERWDNNWQYTRNAIQSGTLKQYEWLAFTYSKKHSDHLEYIQSQLPEYQEVKRFPNRKHKKFILIFQKKH